MPAGWAAAPGPVHNAENECPGPTEARFVGLSPGRCRPAAKRDQTHHGPRQPKAPGPAPSISRAMRAIPFAPCTGADAETPLTTSQLFTGALDPAGEGTKNRGFRRQSRSGSYSAYGWAKRSPAPHSPAMACTAFRGLAWRRGIAFNASPPASSQNRCDRSSGGSCRRRCRCFRP